MAAEGRRSGPRRECDRRPRERPRGARARADARRPALSHECDGERRPGRGCPRHRRPRRPRRARSRDVRAPNRGRAADRRHATRRTLRRMTLRMTAAGEAHGPALVAIVEGLPAGLVLDRAAINADLLRRQQGYGRSPRQRIEQDTVEVLAGLRQGRTLGTPLALVVRNRDHENWRWGMSPWPPEGDP